MRPRPCCPLALCFVLLLAPGCGLVLDLDPPDVDSGTQHGFDAGGPFDAGTGFDAEPRDAGGERDAGLEGDGAVSRPDADPMRPDAALSRDSGPADAGRGGACTSHDDCAPGELCRRATDICFGIGACVARPPTCPDVVAPVCGCDWHLYDNACEAEAAGVNVMRAGSCPSATMADWCPRTVSAPAGPGCTRCFDDRDCAMLPLAPYCVSSVCSEGGEGYCALGPLAPTECWDDRQCRDTERCVGSRSDTCELPLRTGRCR